MPTARRVTRGGELLSISERHLGVLLELLARRGTIVSKDALIEAVWQDVAVTDNSLEQAVSALRRLLGAGPTGNRTSRPFRARDIALSGRSPPLPRAPATMSSRNCWRRIAHGSRGAPRSKRSNAIRSCGRGVCSKACSSTPRSRAGTRRSGQRLHHAVRDDPSRRESRTSMPSKRPRGIHAKRAAWRPSTAKRGRRSVSCSIAPAVPRCAGGLAACGHARA